MMETTILYVYVLLKWKIWKYGNMYTIFEKLDEDLLSKKIWKITWSYKELNPRYFIQKFIKIVDNNRSVNIKCDRT